MAKKINLAERISEMVNDECGSDLHPRAHIVSGGSAERHKDRG